MSNYAWSAGAAEVDVTPHGSVFLYGYPDVPRMSDSIHDPLRVSALALGDGEQRVVFIACDLIWLEKSTCDEARNLIEQATGIPRSRVLISVTHTHSGPVTARMASNLSDKTVPPPDPAYLKRVIDGIVTAARDAVAAMRPAKVTLSSADGSKLGTNRHDPAGPAIPQIQVVAVRDASDSKPLALMCVCSMHPTVLHEDSLAISGDFPGLARGHLQMSLGWDVPLVYHMGAAGNQSPRHVTRANTMEEADRFGQLLANAIVQSLEHATPLTPRVNVARAEIASLKLRDFPGTDEAAAAAKGAQKRLAELQRWGADPTKVRGAEVDWFGAEETLTLSRLKSEGSLAVYVASCLPAEVTAVALGEEIFLTWPAEVFVEFALRVMESHPNVSVITLANGGLQGYVVTEQAVLRGAYEAGNALFRSPDVGNTLVERSLELLKELTHGTQQLKADA